MNREQLLKLISLGETSTVQMKERIDDAAKIGSELVAFSNSHGGRLIVGVNDKTGNVNSLNFEELQRTTQLLGNVASDHVVPPIIIDVETVDMGDGGVVVVTVKEGTNKPYHDNKGVVWVKNGADKRKVFDNTEVAEMLAQSGNLFPDSIAVPGTSIGDLDDETLKQYLFSRFEKPCKNLGINVETVKDLSADEMMGKIIKGFTIRALLQNSGLIRQDGTLTVACLELFGKNPQRWLPGITIKGVCMPGTSIASTTFLDKLDSPDTEGNLLHQYEQIMAFFTRNLHRRQTEEEFNSIGSLEIPYSSLSELTVNALIHRSLTRQAPIRVFIFDDRVEIHSPGTLPGGLSIDEIKQGTSLPRNMLLFNNAIFLLPYTGIGSGIVRALQDDNHIEFLNDEGRQEFIVTLRRTNSDTTESNSQEGNSVREDSKSVRDGIESVRVDKNSNRVDEKSNRESNREEERGVRDGIREDHKSVRDVIPLTDKQQEVLNYCSVPRTSRDILDHLGIVYHSKNIKRYITNLVDSGLLLMSNPEKPNDRNQKYRKA